MPTASPRRGGGCAATRPSPPRGPARAGGAPRAGRGGPAATGLTIAVVTRGYGGRLGGPLRVDPAEHEADAVGDEALLIAGCAPCWVSRDRAAGVREAVATGAGAILLDDGFQNPAIDKDLA